MRLKHIFLIVIAITSSIAAYSQEVIDYADIIAQHQEPMKSRSSLYMQLGYEHSQTHASNINTEMTYKCAAAKWFDFYGGFHIATRNLYQFGIRGDFKWHVGKTRYLALENKYTYSAYANDNMQNMNILLMLAYDQEYFHIGLGGYYQFFTPFVMKEGAVRSLIWEPGITYDVEARIFKKKHIWNLGVQITNVRDYLIEKPYDPNFILYGNYRILGEGEDNLKMTFQAGFQPSGFCNITTNYYSFFFNVGISCVL